MALGRLIFSLLFSSFFLLTLHAQTQPFKGCQLKYHVSTVEIEGQRAFAISEHEVLYYSKQAPRTGLIKRDPFLGLNLVKSSKSFKHAYKFYHTSPKKLAALTMAETLPGEVTKEQVGLNTLAGFSQDIPSNALITGRCCGIVGISTEKGIIQKPYIEHFLNSTPVVYADFGIRVEDKKGKGVWVKEVNPFYENNPFLLHDQILKMDEQAVSSAAQLSRDMLFAKPGSEHRFLILRDNTKMLLSTSSHQGSSGGLVPESFFDLFGLELDEHLVVQKDNPGYEIKKNDRLLHVMGIEVKTLQDVRGVLSTLMQSKEPMVVLLFRRQGFEFFIHFDKPSNSKSSV